MNRQMTLSLLSILAVTVVVGACSAGVPADVRRPADPATAPAAAQPAAPDDGDATDRRLNAAAHRYRNLAGPSGELNRRFESRLHGLLEDLDRYVARQRPATRPATAPAAAATTPPDQMNSTAATAAAVTAAARIR